MLFRKTSLVLAAACVMSGGAAIAQSAAGAGTSAPGKVATTQSVQSESMQRLAQAADRLRQSIQALAQKSPGPDRDRAISEAHDALFRTQQAMTSLPPELRSSGTMSTAGYDETVKKLMGSADSLRKAVQAMAQQPAGERRNEAIREANRALFDTQTALIAAYQPGTAQMMGASGARKEAQTSSNSSASSMGIPAAVLVLLPNALAEGAPLADGCWVRFFDDKNFKGESLTLAGPVDMPKMELGNVWRDWDSARVGPKATVRTFDNENFRDRTTVLSEGQSIPDLREKKLGWFEEVKSARVSCG